MEKETVMKEQEKESTNQTKDKEENVTENDVAMDTEENVNIDALFEDTAEDNTENQDDEAESEKKEKQNKANKSLFKNSKSKELAAKDQKIEELTDRLMRTMAEFDNYRKRTEKEKSQMYDMGVKAIIEKLLPIVDNFERGLGTITEKEKESGFAQGIEMIYKQLLAAFDEIGVKPIDAVGKEFDPNLHNAVMHGEDESLGENIVSDEFQKGYLYRDIVIRHSMVKVVN
ncbi:nucleotide exchange factor GrpE [Lachnospiraceae bacterium MD1]|uniref:Protein GrpE n=2 Tax=Variimorphobacter saccharofermentans TaxID=2755051 RepID=A0A839K1M2_9FIRM|nr:nucleotide exchange factor GrpE [Variimorphobacter saccharofermentans]MBB2183102.1 nucleotide exchange factor GrpE [Variimorphobacter saccharofermentans]